jgi:hypothetical protein
MAKEKEEVLQANAGAPAADIPDLKKKDKERKRAGATWSGVRGGGASDFAGATGGNGARAAASAASASLSSAAAEAVIVAEETTGLWATFLRGFAYVTSTMLGKMAVGAAAALLVAGAGLLGFSLLKGDNTASVGAPDLGGITDSMRVRKGGDDRMGVASKGELRFDLLSAAKPAAAPPAEAKKGEEPPPPEAPAKTDADVSKLASDQLAHNLAGAKLSSNLGGDFGNKNIFAGNSAAPKFGATNVAASSLKKFNPSKGQLGAMKASTARGIPTRRTIGSARTQKAIGQLKMAKGMSILGATAGSNEGASANALGAFDQQQTNGGNLATIGAPGGDSVNPSGNSAPDTTMPTAPATPPSTGTDPGLQNSLDQISALANKAMADMQMGIMLMIIGAILIAIGSAIPFGMGIPLIILGIALIAMGVAKILQAKAEAAQAKAMGDALAKQINDQQQAKAVNYCTDQALAGTPTQDCKPPDSVTNGNAQDAQAQTDIQKVKAIPKDSPVISH